MSDYLKWNEQTIIDFSESNINRLYNDGYIFGRVKKGYMSQTRSLRIDLSTFKLSSENRRILRKNVELRMQIAELPMNDYHWSIGKMAKDFYTEKFGDGTFSANKVKELLTTEHNFNKLFVYGVGEKEIGYCIVLETDGVIHYSYPFYILHSAFQNLGMSMMLNAILYAQKQGKEYIYLGSFQRPGDVYKLQFEGLEWFDGEKWKYNLDELKKVLKT